MRSQADLAIHHLHQKLLARIISRPKTRGIFLPHGHFRLAHQAEARLWHEFCFV